MGSNKPYIVAIFIQITFAGMSLMSKAAFAGGMNTYIFLFYRQAAGSIILLPLTLLLKGYVSFKTFVVIVLYVALLYVISSLFFFF